jgi:hypothetical protein
MSAATLVGIFLIPVFYVLMQSLSERLRGIAGRDTPSPPTPPPGLPPATTRATPP